MADRQDSDREVLTSLPRSRPVRRSTKRAARPEAETAAGAKATTNAAGAAKTRKAPATARATASPAKPKAAAPTATAAPKAPKTAARGTRPPRATASAERPEGRAPRPPRKVPPAGYASPAAPAERDQPSHAAQLVGTAIQAAGELAQIGFAVGRQTLQSMLDRLPKP